MMSSSVNYWIAILSRIRKCSSSLDSPFRNLVIRPIMIRNTFPIIHSIVIHRTLSVWLRITIVHLIKLVLLSLFITTVLFLTLLSLVRSKARCTIPKCHYWIWTDLNLLKSRCSMILKVFVWIQVYFIWYLSENLWSLMTGRGSFDYWFILLVWFIILIIICYLTNHSYTDCFINIIVKEEEGH